MMMTNRSHGRDPTVKRLVAPRFELLYQLDYTFAPAQIEIGPVASGHRSFILFDGARLEGPRMHGRHLPGTTATQIIHPNGIMETEGFLALEMDDGHRISGWATGIASIAPEHVMALAEGAPFDPETFYVRGHVQFEAAEDGPYAWINCCVCVFKTTRLVRGPEISVWQLL